MADISREYMEQIAQMWNARGKGLITHMALEIEKVSSEGVRVRMPFNPDFCVDKDQTLLHGGILTALLDSVFGLANFVTIKGVSSMATLDLRVDYLRAARSPSSARFVFGNPAISPLMPATSGSMATRMRKSPVEPPRSL